MQGNVKWLLLDLLLGLGHGSRRFLVVSNARKAVESREQDSEGTESYRQNAPI